MRLAAALCLAVLWGLLSTAFAPALAAAAEPYGDLARRLVSYTVLLPSTAAQAVLAPADIQPESTAYLVRLATASILASLIVAVPALWRRDEI